MTPQEKRDRKIRRLLDDGYTKNAIRRMLHLDSRTISAAAGDVPPKRKPSNTPNKLDLTNLPPKGAVCVGLRKRHDWMGDSCRLCGEPRINQ